MNVRFLLFFSAIMVMGPVLLAMQSPQMRDLKGVDRLEGDIYIGKQVAIENSQKLEEALDRFTTSCSQKGNDNFFQRDDHLLNYVGKLRDTLAPVQFVIFSIRAAKVAIDHGDAQALDAVLTMQTTPHLLEWFDEDKHTMLHYAASHVEKNPKAFAQLLLFALTAVRCGWSKFSPSNEQGYFTLLLEREGYQEETNAQTHAAGGFGEMYGLSSHDLASGHNAGKSKLSALVDSRFEPIANKLQSPQRMYTFACSLQQREKVLASSQKYENRLVQCPEDKWLALLGVVMINDTHLTDDDDGPAGT